MIHFLFLTSLCVSVLFLIGKAYSTISKKSPSNLLELKEINASVKKMSGGWWFLIPFISLLALVYNVTVTAVWFVLEALNLLMRIIAWVWTEVIISAGYFLFKLFWHYCISWPWKILRMAFDSIRPSFKWSYFKIGFLGLALSFLIAFLGRYLTNTFNWWHGINLFFAIVSIIPIGLSISHIVFSRKENSQSDNKTIRNKYLSHLIFLLVTFLIFICIECGIIYLGSLTTMGYALSALFAGGNIITSLFIILNAGLLFFALSALPSFSQDYGGTNKELLKSFGTHLMHKWPQYILALPAMVIPAIIVSIIPYFLSQGASFVTEKASNRVYEHRIFEAENEASKNETFNYADWLNVTQYPDDQVKKLMVKDINQVKNDAELSMLKKNQAYMTMFYNRHASCYGAAPAIALAYGFNEYSNYQNRLTNTEPYDQLPSASTVAIVDLQNKLDKNVIPEYENNIKEYESTLRNLDDNLTHACDSIADNNNTPPPAVTDTTKASQQSSAALDNCELKKREIRDEIEGTEKNKNTAIASKARAEMISKHLLAVKREMDEIRETGTASEKTGHFLITLWMCVIMAFAFAFLIPLFAILNHSVYSHSDGSSKYYLIQEIEAANQINKNQPLMGLLLLPFLFPLLMMLHAFVHPAIKYTKSAFKIVKMEALYNKLHDLASPIKSFIINNNNGSNSIIVAISNNQGSNPQTFILKSDTAADNIILTNAPAVDTTMSASIQTDEPTYSMVEAQDPTATTEVQPEVLPENTEADNSTIGTYLLLANENQKVFIYSNSNNSSEKLNYLNSKFYVNVKAIENNFGYIEYINNQGRKTAGWVELGSMTKISNSMIQN